MKLQTSGVIGGNCEILNYIYLCGFLVICQKEKQLHTQYFKVLFSYFVRINRYFMQITK